MKQETNLFMLLVFLSVLFAQTACKSNCFMNKYTFSSDGKAGVFDFETNSFRQINYAKFLETIYHSETAIIKFMPHKEVVLSDNSGKNYKLYFSERNQYFKIDGYGFRLSKKQSKTLTALFE